MPLADPSDTIAAATKLAAVQRHPHVGSEHIGLLAMAGSGGLAAIAAAEGIVAAAVGRSLASCCSVRPSAIGSMADPHLTPRAIRLIAVSSQLAGADGSPTIEAVHLTRALLEEPDSIAWRGLLRARLTPIQVLDSLHRKRQASSEMTFLPSTSGRLFRALEQSIVILGSELNLQRVAPTERRSGSRRVAEARSALEAFANFGLRLGYVSPAQLEAMSRGDPDEAWFALQELTESPGTPSYPRSLLPTN